MGKIGFIHDLCFNIKPDVIEETDTGNKTSIDVVPSVVGDSELSIIDFDSSQNLPTAGISIKTKSDGSLIDKHSNFRYIRTKTRSDIIKKGWELGAARFVVEENGYEKSKDEYWCLHNYLKKPNVSASSPLRNSIYHDGVTYYSQMKFDYPVSGKATINIATITDLDSDWTYVDVAEITYKLRIFDGTDIDINPSPAFVVIPNVGVVVFFYSVLNRVNVASYEMNAVEFVQAYLTKNNGATWEKFTEFELNPFFGEVLPPTNNGQLTKQENSCLKVIYYNNKIIVGTMLQGTLSPTQSVQERVGYGRGDPGHTQNYTLGYKIIPGTLTLVKNGDGISGSGTTVGTDDGAGNLIGTNITGGVINYDDGTITFTEDPIFIFDVTESIDVEYQPDTLRLSRILNIVYSNDLGKSWNTVPMEFISASLFGPLPTSSYCLGYDSIDFIHDLPTNFGLGFDVGSDKVVLALRNAGKMYNNVTDPYGVYNYRNMSKLKIFYNISDDLMEWKSDFINGETGLILSAFDEGNLNSFTQFKVTSATGLVDWQIENNIVYQNGAVTGPTYAHGQANGGTHLVYDDIEDPTVRRSIGVGVKFYARDSKTFGLGFCRSSSTNFYAVTITFSGTASTIAYATVYLKKVISGVETTISTRLINCNRDTWHDLKVLFKGNSTIMVFVDDLPALVGSDTDIYEGSVFLIANDMADVTVYPGIEFDELRVYPSNCGISIPYGFGGTGTHINKDFRSIGSNIELMNDEFGQSWLACDVTNIHLDTADGISSDNYVCNGIVFQKYKLQKSIQRITGKFLGEDKYTVILGNEENGNSYLDKKDVGSFFDINEYGVFNSYGSLNPIRYRAILESAYFRKDHPCFVVTASDLETYNSYIIHGDSFSSKRMMPSFGYSLIKTIDQSNYGWDSTGTINDVVAERNNVVEFAVNNSYIHHGFDLITNTFSANTPKSAPISNISLDRGSTYYFSTYSGNQTDYASYKTVFEIVIPLKDKTVNQGQIRFRIVWHEESIASANDGYFSFEAHDGAIWQVADTYVYGASKGSVTDMWEFYVAHITPEIGLTFTQPFVVHMKLESSEEWVMKDMNLYISGHTPPANLNADVKFGSFDGSIGGSKQYFKTNLSYGNTGYVNYSGLLATDNISGDCLQSGERLYSKYGVVYTISGGNAVNDDSWLLTDEFTRAFPKENILDRPSVLWKSDNDSVDKSIVIDLGYLLEYDSIILYGTNCREIVVEANDTNVWTAPAFSETISMVMNQFGDLYYNNSTLSPSNNVFKYNGTFGFKPNEISDKIIMSFDDTKCARVLSNFEEWIRYFNPRSEFISSASAKFQVLSDRIAIKLSTRRRNRYFRLTFKKTGINYPTPEGYFTLGKFYAGTFEQLAYNPEYPVKTQYMNNFEKVSVNDVDKLFTRNKVTQNKTLLFKAVGMEDNQFGNKLLSIFKHVKNNNVLYYVEDISEFQGTFGTYTFNVLCCYLDNKLSTSLNWGTLSDVIMVLKETL